MNRLKYFTVILSVLTLALLTACGSEGSSTEEKKIETLVFADVGWDSIRFHNAVSKIIIEEGIGGYTVEEMPVGTPASMEGLKSGDISVHTEFWTDNLLEDYNALLETGKAVELGENLSDNGQGIYVPTYMIEGDPERGIEPMTPDLKKVEDLPKYWEVFKDPEDPDKGRIIGSITGWHVDEVLKAKMKYYKNLDETFNYFQPGSEAALTTSLVTAYEEGEPWVGYYWEPTWVLGKYDMTKLEEAPFNKEEWDNGYTTAFPSNRITVVANKEVVENAPEVADYLSNYSVTTEIVNAALAHMEDTGAEIDETAVWFLKEYEDVWTTWVPAEVAEQVKSSIQ